MSLLENTTSEYSFVLAPCLNHILIQQQQQQYSTWKRIKKSILNTNFFPSKIFRPFIFFLMLLILKCNRLSCCSCCLFLEWFFHGHFFFLCFMFSYAFACSNMIKWLDWKRLFFKTFVFVGPFELVLNKGLYPKWSMGIYSSLLRN